MFFATFCADVESGVEHYANNDERQSETAPENFLNEQGADLKSTLPCVEPEL